MKLTLAFSAVVFLLCIFHAEGNKSIKILGKNFYLVTNRKATWSTAKAYCRKLWGGLGRLANIENEAENYHLSKALGSRTAWFGGNDISSEGTWVWDTGCPMKGRFKKWSKGEPNDHWWREDCMQMYANGKWNDKNCGDKLNFVCQKFINDDLCINYGKNIAKGRRTWQSSTYKYGYSSRAVDGNVYPYYDGKSCSVTKNAKQNWLVIDLGSAQRVSVVQLFNRLDAVPAADQLNNFGVSVSHDKKPVFKDDKSYPSNAQLCESRTKVVGEKAALKCKKGIQGRYVFITKLSGSLSICEAKVFGKASTEYKYYNNVAYYMQKSKKMSWGDAAKFCAKLWGGQGMLATAESRGENSFIKRNMYNGRHTVWLGATDSKHEGYYVWSNNCEVDKNGNKNSLWNRREPNNCCKGENCLSMAGGSGGKWNDVRCSAKFYFVCQRADKKKFCKYLGPNIARGKKAWQSSTGFNGVAKRATDGNVNQNYKRNGCTHTGNRGPNYLFIDLGKFYKVKIVELLNRLDCCSNRLADFAVSTGYVYDEDRYNLKFTNLIPTGFKLCHYQKAAVGRSISINCNGAVGRHIAIVKRSNILSLCEAKAYGDVTKSPRLYCYSGRKKYKVGAKWSNNAVCQKYECTSKGTKILSAGCRQGGKCYKVGDKIEDKSKCLKMRCEVSGKSRKVAVTERGCRHSGSCKSHAQVFLETSSCKKYECKDGKLSLKQRGCRLNKKCVADKFKWSTKDICREEICDDGKIKLVKQECPLNGKCVKINTIYNNDKDCGVYKCKDSGRMHLTSQGCRLNKKCVADQFAWETKLVCRKEKCDNGKITLVSQECPLNGKCVAVGYNFDNKKNCAQYTCSKKGSMMLVSQDCEIDNGCIKTRKARVSTYSIGAAVKDKPCTYKGVKYSSCSCIDSKHVLIEFEQKQADPIII